jgi:lysophospholipase L1-like esterase
MSSRSTDLEDTGRSPANSGGRRWLAPTLLVATSLLLSLAAVEVLLRAESMWVRTPAKAVGSAPPSPPTSPSTGDQLPPELVAKVESRRNLMTMPEEWRRVPVEVPGAARAYRWHGHIEVHNQEGMRWAAPFPAKRPEVYRVMVVGDSLTYGQGLPEQDTFVALLNRWMGGTHRIEFLNMGVQGYQSTDVLRVVKKFVPELKPDLVIYAVCLNDFLPSGRGQYRHDYEFPLPDEWKRFFIRHTRLGALMDQAYDKALRGLHLRRDFFDDILRDFEGYQQRFRQDVGDMNAAIGAAGLPPLIAIVVDQYVTYDGRGHRIARAAEKYLAEAGAEVIGTDEYYRKYNGRMMRVSNWEGHPNEIANYIWARMVSQILYQREDLRDYKRSD